jgi:hypothetical protein
MLLPLCSLLAAGLTTTAQFRSLIARKQSSAARAAVEEAIEEAIAADSATPVTRLRGLGGRWKLEWSSQTADVNPFASPASVMGGALLALDPSTS